MTVNPGPAPNQTALDREAAACLERTRSAVVNVLVAAGTGIAISGLLLRWRDRWAVDLAPASTSRAFTAGLVALMALSYATRRAVAGRGALRDPLRRAGRFYLGHVLSAALAALAVPLGLAHGWLVRPRIDAVAPYWFAALALGSLAFPRAAALEGFDEPMPGAGPARSEPPS
jgi:hypothetical protein